MYCIIYDVFYEVLFEMSHVTMTRVILLFPFLRFNIERWAEQTHLGQWLPNDLHRLASCRVSGLLFYEWMIINVFQPFLSSQD